MLEHVVDDCGRHMNKIISSNGYRDHYPSYVGEYRDLRLTNSLRATDIYIKTKEGLWFLGDLAKDESKGASRMMIANKIHLDTKLLILAGVARCVTDGSDVIVTTGVPIKYHSKETKKRFNDLLLGDYSVEINSRVKKFRIVRVNVAVEGASAYTSLCNGQQGVKRFIDIGSRTVNYGTVVNGRYHDSSSDTLDYGYDTVDSDPQAISRKIASDLSRAWTDLSEDTYIFGGGATKCYGWLSNYFDKLKIAEDPEWVNAESFYLIGEYANGA